MAIDISNGHFQPFATRHRSKGKLAATRLKPTGNTRVLVVNYTGNGNITVKIR